MKFGPTKVAEAEGAVLAHGIVAPGVNFKKGRALSAADIAALTTAGIAEVMAARVEKSDVAENVAAQRIGEAATGAHASLSAAHTGRSNIYAAERGLVVIDAARVNALNAIHESITIATLMPYEVVEPRQMLATIKIIPYAAPESAVAAATEVAGTPAPLLRVAPFVAKKVALVSTTLPGMKPSLLDKNLAVLTARAEHLGSRVTIEKRCAHETQAIAAAVREAMSAKPDLLLIFGASATTDRADVAPAGLIAAGGTVDHFGMPVDPGNLLLLGKISGIPAVGLPGCARSPKINGFDFVLQRLCADLSVTRDHIVAMGVGGLLKEIPTRPQPRDLPADGVPRAPKIAALVLAAGRSTRMGETNKLLMPLHGKPMIARTIDAVTASPARPIIVVTGHNADAVKQALNGASATFVHNPSFADGLSTSLKAGLAALPADADGVLICLGDMPAVTGNAIAKLIAAFNPTEGRAIVVPTYQGKRGNPVLFARAYLDEMRRAEGDQGARVLLSEHDDAVYEVEMEDAGVLADADTPAAFAALEADFKS